MLPLIIALAVALTLFAIINFVLPGLAVWMWAVFFLVIALLTASNTFVKTKQYEVTGLTVFGSVGVVLVVMSFLNIQLSTVFNSLTGLASISGNIAGGQVTALDSIENSFWLILLLLSGTIYFLSTNSKKLSKQLGKFLK